LDRALGTDRPALRRFTWASPVAEAPARLLGFVSVAAWSSD